MTKNQYKKSKKTSFSLSNIKKSEDIIGVDEAGRGAWAGPVVAACVFWSGKNPLKNRLQDSKKMKEKDREKTYEEILKISEKNQLMYGVGIIENTVIDTVGIREANRLAMEGALLNMMKNKPKQSTDVYLLIDGRDNYQFDISGLPEPIYIVKGDEKVKQIMAASIVAKVTRDRIMVGYEDIFPGYGFIKHKGYGTQIHQDALQKIGISSLHRKSYRPISSFA